MKSMSFKSSHSHDIIMLMWTEAIHQKERVLNHEMGLMKSILNHMAAVHYSI